MNHHLGIGLMSGTSLDGLDICAVRFAEPDFTFEILAAETLPYTQEWKSQLKNATGLDGEALTRLDFDYGRYLGQKVNEFLKRHPGIHPDFIASHGHTVFHRPDLGYTLQIGRGEAIFDECRITTIWDFRTEDVAQGGQGAPLVPIGDRLLFGNYAACLNLGGFSNISFEKEGERIAFDISPVNIVLNALAAEEGQTYDKDGSMAASGKVLPNLLEALNALEFYNRQPPKSLGFEWVEANILPLLTGFHAETKDLLATFTLHAAMQIAEVFNRYKFSEVLVSGGGAYNIHLMEHIRNLSECSVIIPDSLTVEYKEALIFALMGLLKLKGKINVLKSATGGKRDLSAGRRISL